MCSRFNAFRNRLCGLGVREIEEANVSSSCCSSGCGRGSCRANRNDQLERNLKPAVAHTARLCALLSRRGSTTSIRRHAVDSSYTANARRPHPGTLYPSASGPFLSKPCADDRRPFAASDNSACRQRPQAGKSQAKCQCAFHMSKQFGATMKHAWRFVPVQLCSCRAPKSRAWVSFSPRAGPFHLAGVQRERRSLRPFHNRDHRSFAFRHECGATERRCKGGIRCCEASIIVRQCVEHVIGGRQKSGTTSV
jgi:hypothetical protein